MTRMRWWKIHLCLTKMKESLDLWANYIKVNFWTLFINSKLFNSLAFIIFECGTSIFLWDSTSQDSDQTDGTISHLTRLRALYPWQLETYQLLILILCNCKLYWTSHLDLQLASITASKAINKNRKISTK